MNDAEGNERPYDDPPRRTVGAFFVNAILGKGSDPTGAALDIDQVLRERSELRKRHESLQQRIEALSQELARRDGALTTLLHELRNPVAPLVGAAQVLQKGVGGEERESMIEVILRQSRVLKGLLDEAASAVAMPHERLNPCPVVMQEALRHAVEGFRAEAEHKRQALELLMPATPVVLQADPERLQQMLLNLLANAVKYTPREGRIAVTATEEGGMAVLSVDDDGVGISPQNLAHIFELFSREDDADPAAPRGLGIGLAVVRRLAGLHGGCVEAHSAGKGKGSRFTLRLPVARAVSLPAPSSPQEASAPDRSF